MTRLSGSGVSSTSQRQDAAAARHLHGDKQPAAGADDDGSNPVNGKQLIEVVVLRDEQRHVGIADRDECLCARAEVEESGMGERHQRIADGWCPKMYADKRRANKKQRRHGIFELCKFKLPFAAPVAVGRI